MYLFNSKDPDTGAIGSPEKNITRTTWSYLSFERTMTDEGG
ncbi:MAG: hypothetical protein U0518_02165 [Candidatus Gracilibacteria bacterium]